jgi:hypothetical protein
MAVKLRDRLVADYPKRAKQGAKDRKRKARKLARRTRRAQR